MTKKEKLDALLTAGYLFGALQLGYMLVCNACDKEPWWKRKPDLPAVKNPLRRKYAEVPKGGAE